MFDKFPPSRLEFFAIAALFCVSLLLVACSKCEPVGSSAPTSAASGSANTTAATASGHGIVTVDASISKGSVFRLYYNGAWKQSLTQPITPGAFTSYRFEVPPTLDSLRFDFSDAPDAVAIVRKIGIQLPGRPARVLNLLELRAWVQNNCVNTYDPATRLETVRATGPGMFTMGSIYDYSMRAE